MTLVPWADGKQLLWDVTVVDSLAPYRINAEAEERKIDKYKDLVNDGYLFPPLAFEIQGAVGPSTEVFLSKLCKNQAFRVRVRVFGYRVGFSGFETNFGFRVGFRVQQIFGFGFGFGYSIMSDF